MNILIVKLGAIGDVIQTAAGVALVREEMGGARIDWIAGKQTSGLLECFGVSDRIFEIDEKRLFQEKYRLIYLALLMLKIALWSSGKYDRIVIPQRDWKYKLLTMLVRAKKTVTLKNSVSSMAAYPQRSRTTEVYSLITDVEKATIDLPKGLKQIGQKLLNRDTGVSIQLPLSAVVLCPGGAKNLLRTDSLRRWPIENYKELTRRLVGMKRNVVLIGGAEDSWVSESFREYDVLDLIGKTNVMQAIQVMSIADVVVAHDSGPLHMATITEAGLVALFGPTPANAVVAFGRPRTIVLRAENRISCSPCYDGREYADCGDAVCMEYISVESVLGAITELEQVRGGHEPSFPG